jgi:DNA-binding XRE family transcriptional regulator
MLKQPTPGQVRQLRELAQLTQTAAAELVHASSWRTWWNWEAAADSAEAREIPLAAWELFLRKLEEGTGPAAGEARRILRGR